MTNFLLIFQNYMILHNQLFYLGKGFYNLQYKNYGNLIVYLQLLIPQNKLCENSKQLLLELENQIY